jgi:AhpD family alkylhydroperoxidase
VERINYYHASPAGMKTIDTVYAHVLQSGLSKTLADLIILRVSHINGCAYCIDTHSRELLNDNVSSAKLAWFPSGVREARYSMRPSARRLPGPRR